MPGGSSRYVLVDGAGKISCYLLPTAGIELGPHVGRQIGVTGRALTHRHGSPPSIFVKEITPLEAAGPSAKASVTPSAEVVQADYVEDAGGAEVLPDPTTPEPTTVDPTTADPTTVGPVTAEPMMADPMMDDVQIGDPEGVLSPVPDTAAYVLPSDSGPSPCSPCGVSDWSWIAPSTCFGGWMAWTCLPW